jgi:hypothetical protein
MPPEPALAPDPTPLLSHRVLPLYDERRYRADVELLSRAWGSSSVEAEEYARSWGVATLADEARYGKEPEARAWTTGHAHEPPTIAGF